VTAADALCEELPWDSHLFGISIARAIPRHVDAASCRAMLHWCEDHDIDCLYFLAPAGDTATVAELERAGFRAVGVRVTLRRTLDPATPLPKAATRMARPQDVPRLRDIASASHRDTRFYVDGRFDPQRCDELYATWIDKSVNGYADHVIVTDRNNAAVGYATLHLDASSHQAADARHATIGLVAVDREWRHQGIGRDLVQGVVHKAAAAGAATISVVASGDNVAAVRLYESEGFRTTDRSMWYHRWFD
jgi:ribosomal protein S18 acetylase RimI-like enzyme